MKYWKYAAATLLGLSILAVVVHFYRESIARELANSTLREYGITATELSIRTLRPDYLKLSHIVLEQDSGASYRISELSLPLDFSRTNAKKISMEQLLVSSARTNGTPTPLSRLVQTFLQLPGNVPNTEVTVAHFEIPDADPIENLLWQCGEQQQHLEFSIRAIDVTVNIDRVDDANHQVTVRAAVDGITDALSMTLSVRRNESGFTVGGPSRLHLAPWLPLLKSLGILPADTDSMSGEIDGQIEIVLDDDPTRAVIANADLSLDGEVAANYGAVTDQSIRIRASSSEALRLGFHYPSLKWTANSAQMDVLLGFRVNDDVPVRLNNLACRSGIQCTLEASLDTGPFKLGAIAVGNANVATSLSISNDEQLQVDIAADSTLKVTAIESQGFSVETIIATQFSGARMTVEDGTASFATDFSIRPQTATVSWDGNDIILPGVAGKMSFHRDLFKTSLELSDDEGTLSARLDVSHNLVNGRGSMSVHQASLLFDRGKLSSHVSNWTHAWDIASGTLRTDVGLDWKTNDDGTDYHGTMTFQSDNLAGNFNDIAFTGLNNNLTAIVDSASGVTTLPTSINVALLDIGLPLEQIAVDFALNVQRETIQVQKLSMQALGGQLETDPFIFDSYETSHDIILRPRSIQLQFMVDLAEYEDLELSGSISGLLPLTITGKSLTIAGGQLENDPPGGVIRYLPGIDIGSAEVSDSPLDLVSRALANFQYDSLTSDVDYTESGDLVLQMKLAGINPDMDENQPVILNLGVENNVPQLLRSLQAIRSIEDILERRSE